MKQLSFAQAEYATKRKVTRRERFLGEMEQVVPWSALIAALAPFYFPDAGKGRGRRPIGLERMLRMWDEAKDNDAVDVLVRDLFSQLSAIGAKAVTERTDHELFLALGNVYLLEREGYIRSDEYNGIQFLRLKHPGTTH